MQLRQISVFLENRPGLLSQACRDLASAGVNILALSLADADDFGILRMIVNDYARAQAVLAERGYATRVNGVVAVVIPDRPGGMADVLAVLDRVNADIEYSYAFAAYREGKAALVFRVADDEAASRALEAAGYSILTEAAVLAHFEEGKS